MELETSREYKDIFKRAIFYAIIQLIIGILFFFLKLENTLNFFTILFGIYFVIISIPRLLFTYNDKSRLGKYAFYSAIVYLVIGFLLIFFQMTIVNIIAAIFLVILPLVRVGLSENKKETFKNELFNIIVGLFVILFGFASIIKVLRYVAGAIIILFAIYNIIIAFINYRKAKQNDKIIDAKIREIK